MEYVEGAADRRATATRTRARPSTSGCGSFREVCDGGRSTRTAASIVHRDLKPSNILVTADGEPKLLDFGIAKLLDPSDAARRPARTMTAMRLLTPAYASPEQVRGEPVTTATDVYALGVLLYELLTGKRPHTFRTLTAQEIERVVCDTDAPHPSTISPGLAEDLDIIVGTALNKDVEHRYLSVEALVEDLRRYLEGLPIHARRATWW